MRAYYEERWQTLPRGVPPHELAARRAWLLARVSAGDAVLDVGCGAGQFARALADAGARVIAVDIAEAALARAREAVPEAELHRWPEEGRLPLPDASIDVVWAGEVLEHVADTAAWLSELWRVLRAGGRLLISTPSHDRLGNLLIALVGFERHADPLGEHLRFYTRRSLRSTLEALGFTDVRVAGMGGAPGLRATLLAEAVRPTVGLRVASGA